MIKKEWWTVHVKTDDGRKRVLYAKASDRSEAEAKVKAYLAKLDTSAKILSARTGGSVFLDSACSENSKLFKAAKALLKKIDTITTEQFSQGAERDEREALREAIAEAD